MATCGALPYYERYFREYAGLGVGTVIVALEPATPESIAELGRAAALARG